MTDRLSSEHVLIVGGGREIPGLVRAARPDIATTVLCRTDQVGRVRNPWQHDRVVAVAPGADTAEWIALAEAVHRRHPITRVGAFAEGCQDHAAAIALALGLAFHTPRTIALVHDKEAMRARLRATGVDDTPSARVRDAADLSAFLARHGTPCIVKPIRGSGSFGVSVVRHPDDAASAFARAAAPSRLVHGPGVLVERFHEGPQVSVEALSEKGEHVVVAITRKYSDPTTLVEVGHAVPAPLHPSHRQAVERLVTGVLTALGIEHGVTHTEVVLAADGPHVIETHVRPAGDDIPDLVRDATGVDLVDCLVRQTLGDPVLADVRRALAEPDTDRPAHAIWFAAPTAAGHLTEITGLSEVLAHPDVVTAEVTAEVGTEIGPLTSSEARVASVRARGDSADAAVRAAQEALGRLTMTVRVGAWAGTGYL